MRFPTWEKFPHFPVFVCWRRPLFFIVCISYKIKSCSYVAGEKKSWDDLHSWSTAELLGFGGERMWEEPTLKTTSHQQQPHTRFEKGTLKYSTPPVLRRGGDTRQLPTSILKATPFHTFDIVGAMTTPSLGGSLFICSIVCGVGNGASVNCNTCCIWDCIVKYSVYTCYKQCVVALTEALCL